MEVSKAHIWELEKGRTDNPSMALVTRLADHFGVSVAYLVGRRQPLAAIGSFGAEVQIIGVRGSFALHRNRFLDLTNLISQALQSSVLYKRIEAALPVWLTEDQRMEAISEAAISILSGDIAMRDLERAISISVKKYWKNNPSKFGPASLDAPAFVDGTTTLLETIREDRRLW